MTFNPAPTTLALSDVLEERQRQHAAHGTQTLSHGLRFSERREMAALLTRCRAAQEPKARRWADVLLEEVCEAVLATDAASRRAELVQVAAVAVQQIEAIDREAQTRPSASLLPGTFTHIDDGGATCRLPEEVLPGSLFDVWMKRDAAAEAEKAAAAASAPPPSAYSAAWQRVNPLAACAHEVAVPGCCRCDDLPGYDANGSPT